jgi:ubiquitin-conjugating enzyme E2 Z
MSSNPIICKDTIHRLIKDIKQIIQSPLVENGIFYKHDEEDMLKGYALIIGPEDTPYHGGYYLFELFFPNDYPHSPPKVMFCTNGENIRFNPNLYITGKVCVSLLNTWRGDQWTSCQTISTVLLTLCSLLCKNPLLNEPGINDQNIDLFSYNEIIEFSNISIAVCDIVDKKPFVFLDKFEIFYKNIIDHFQLNYQKHIAFIENKLSNEIFKNNYRIRTEIYRLSVNINYKELLKKINKTMEMVKLL